MRAQTFAPSAESADLIHAGTAVWAKGRRRCRKRRERKKKQKKPSPSGLSALKCSEAINIIHVL